MHGAFFTSLRDFSTRFGRRPALGPVSLRLGRAGHAAREGEGSMKEAAGRGSRDGSARRCGAYLGLVLAALTQASGCGSECDMSRLFYLTVELVDESGVPLDSEALAEAFEAAEIEICVDGPESHCFTERPEVMLTRGMFEVSHSDLAYPERRRCQLPMVRFTVEVPNCDSGEFLLDDEVATNQTKFEPRTGMLTIVCPGA
ncbi:hypothetical protein SAMN02745121_07353 [Nannocystis exedens]|uniref:Uncharacterized protein n=1 Tax=Nannocystis exedens TaxID=54 RepID=A0A1I2GKH7_9BACT|nr:hypothetical protein [Nannocystis exedens]PCC73604.1 hypothetical protein NAEX_06692 [Nannocystis exedens]SFF17748.1 hypothetical protein SAMN02745121_07353 [Nannocystis exedens]